jgi:flagella synthesis protein FlgN
LSAGRAIAHTGEFAASIKAELEAFRELVQVLQTEEDTLIRGDVDQLSELARTKSEKVILLSQLAAKRTQFLTRQGFSGDRAGMGKWLEQHDVGGAQEISAIWNELIEQAELSRQLNQTNGMVIETRLRHNQQALAVLQAAAMQQSATYGPDGQTHTHIPGMGRPLGKV